MSKQKGRVIDLFGDPGRQDGDPGPSDPDGGDPDDRPTCLVRPGRPEPLAVSLEALSTIKEVYSRGGELVEVAEIDGRPVSVAVTEASLSYMLADVLRYQSRRRTKDSGWQLYDIAPPVLAVRAVHCRGRWSGVLPLRAMVNFPPVHPDGSVRIQPGYDPATGAYYCPIHPIHPISRRRKTFNKDHCIEARGELLNLVGDFPWATPLDADVWIAALLSPLVRIWSGPAPLVAFVATTPRSGKSLLSDLISTILGGRPMARSSWADDLEEARKALVALARSGPALILLDNVETFSEFGDPVLDMALTSETIFGRILGKSRYVEVDLRACWYATGNNLRLAGDTARRTLLCRLEPQCECPEDRTDFAQEDILTYVAQERERYLRAATILLSGYFSAGCPNTPRPLGGFSGWSRAVRGAIIWAGGADVVDAIASRSPVVDSEAELHRRLLGAWLAALPYGASAAQAIACTEEYGEESGELATIFAEICPGRGSDAIGTPRRLAGKIRALEGRIRDVKGHPLRLVRQDTSGAVSWSVEEVSE
jgi:putative DNA primase/helicase